MIQRLQLASSPCKNQIMFCELLLKTWAKVRYALNADVEDYKKVLVR